MICKVCKNPADDHALTCDWCGAVIREEQISIWIDEQKAKRENRRNTILFILSILAALLVVGIYVNNNSSPPFVRMIPSDSSGAGNNHDHAKPNIEASNSYITFTVKTKTFFHNEPNGTSVRKGFLIAGDIVDVEHTVNGFGYVTYTNTKGIVTRGWIKMADLY